MSSFNSTHPGLRLRLAPRLIGLVVLTALVTGGLVGVVLIQNSRTIVREDILASNLATADLVAKFASKYIEGAETNVRQFAARPLFIRAVLEQDLTAAEMHLAQFLEIDPRFDLINVYDAQGLGWASGLKGNWPNRGGTVADREWFQQIVTSRKPYMGIPILSRSTGNPIIPYAVPIFDDRREIHAVLIGGLSLEALSDAVAGLRTSSFTRASLLDARPPGMIIAHSDPKRILTPVTGRNAAALRALSGERGLSETPSSSGEWVLAAFSPVHGLPWSVLISEPVETAFAPINRLTVTAGFCLGVLILIAAALGSWFVRKITRPVRELVAGTEEISKGNLDHSIPVRGQDEIGRLAHAFNTMTTNLKQSSEERNRMEEALREERNSLEERVVERTQALQESERRLVLLGHLRQALLGAEELPAKLNRITDGVVEIFGADFARIWMTGEADLCDKGCCHAAIREGPDVCPNRTLCLHLMASSGRYRHLDGDHRRVPFGCGKVGHVACGEDLQVITNEVTSDPLVHDHEWAQSLGLVSFAGFQLLSTQGRPIGVMALFSRRPIQHQDEMHLQGLASTTSQVILEGMAKEALAKSEEKYRGLFANAQIGMFRSRLDGSAMLDVNQKMADISGCSVEELLNKPATMRWANPDARSEMVRLVLKQGVLTDHEVHILTKHGEVKTCLISVKLYRQEGYLEGTAVDITERKRAQEALYNSNQMLQLVLDNIPQRVFWKDRQLRYLGANRHFASDAGYTDPSELVGKDDFDLLGKETAELNRAQDERVMASDTPDLDYQVALARPDGRLLWLRVNKVPLHDSHGAVIGVLGTYRDITERKAARQALSTEKERLERASAAGKVALWECDIESGALEWFGVVDSMLGFGVGESPRTVQAWNAIIHPDERIHVQEIMKRHLKHNDPYEIDYRVQRADGAYIWWHTIGSSQRNADGRVTRMTGTCIDITERKKAEEERLALERRLQQAQKSESLGRMAGAIAHHFNNKLGAVIGYLELAQTDLPPESKTLKYLDRALSATFQSAKISRMMLAYLGQTVGKREPVDLAQTTREALIVLTALLPDKVRLSTAAFPAHGPSILADSGQITLILTNLVTNAVEAIGDQEGDITVAIGVMPASELRESSHFRADWDLNAEKYACLSVSDTGCGIEAAVHDRIFDPFYTTKFTGRGLGLAVVHGIMKAHDGAITLESQPGQGATFHVFFPLL